MPKRVYCLYRVSTKGQVEKDDIPMQRQACHEFAASKGWDIIKEFSEKGVSGFKVSAKDRDAIQEIQKDAALSKFDILLVFMFDRLGRKEDETPFVVEWFDKNGIEVWSTVEGQQRFDNHVDKLMNYIRYWQASGESIKTSIRTKTRLSQIVLEGKFRGGIAPYGYQLVKNGRKGKKNRELYDIEINPSEASVVKKIFALCLNFGYGGRRIASSLANEGIFNRSGERFHYSTIQNMLKNVMYEGVLRSGETHSDVFPDLQIIDQDTFQRVNHIISQRSNKNKERDVPRTTVGRTLLSGNIYCGHCGGRLFASTARKSHHPTSDGSSSERIAIYKCYNRTQHKELCNGPSTYRAAKVDEVVREMIMSIFKRIKAANESDLVEQSYKEQIKTYSSDLKKAKAEYIKRTKELNKLDGMMVEAIDGNAFFTPEQLKRRMDTVEIDLNTLKDEINNIQDKISESALLVGKIQKEYNQLISWADVFSNANLETQKMIASYMIKRVTLKKNYELEVEYNFDENQFEMGLDI